jgi:hypothetical protein
MKPLAAPVSSGLICLLIAAVALPSVALAAPSAAEKAEAEALFLDARKLMNQKRWPEACRKLESSYRLEVAAGTLLNLALCHEGEGKLATAWVEFNDSLSQAKLDKKADRIKLAQEHLAGLEHRLPWLTVRFEASPPEGIHVQRDGAELTGASYGTAIPVDPGEHVVRATAPQFEPFEGKVILEEGQRETLVIPPLVPAPRQPLPEPSPAASSSAPVPLPTDPGRRSLGWAAGGLGAASLLVGSFFGVRALRKKAESDASCPTATTCSAGGVQANDAAHSAANFANIGLGVGLVGLGAGAYLLLTSSPPAQSARYRFSPVVSHDGGGLLVFGHF